jgi:hypothetical protein
VRAALATLALLVAVGLLCSVPARAATIYSYDAKPPRGSGSRPASVAKRSVPARPAAQAAPVSAARAPSTAPARSVARAPSGPPLSVGSGGEQGPSASAPPSGEDALVANGLGSPLCGSRGELPASALQDCETAGFVAAADPTGDYAFDVNIDSGISALGNNISIAFQNVSDSGWMTFVSVTHGLIVMFEWCYSLDLLSGPLMGEITRALHSSRLMFTEPWLAFVLSIASVLAVYHGLIRRRVAETLGQVLAMLAMMVGGLWVIADPAGTVGMLERWANQAGLGTLATVASGTPSHPERTLAGDMQMLFSGVVSGPWCFLEFGNVDWCRSPDLLDHRLKQAALAIARHEQSRSGCRSLCGAQAGARDRTLAASAALLREAQSNGELFLALPANESERNSVKTEGMLLNVLCGSDESAEKCSGPTAAQAEFRTTKGTYQRVAGLLLIWAGGLGMLLLFGFIALRLLIAALHTLFYLLLAPAAVLAPALGDGGRSAFRTWTLRLLEAVVAKLIYSFLLGAALMMTSALLDLAVLGWMAQWLLISAFWWTAFAKRHQMVGLIDGTTRNAAASPRRSLARRVKEAIETPRMMLAPAVWAGRKVLAPPKHDPERRRRRERAGQEAAHKRAEEQVTRTLEHDHGDAHERVNAAPQIQTRLSARREQLQRVQRERRRALAAGDVPRAAKLGVRERRIEGQIAREQRALNQARKTVAAAETAARAGGSPHTHEKREQRARFLDEQAALPAAGRSGPDGRRRDYAAMASLAGHARENYEQLAPRAQREARLRIDRELALRSRLDGAVRDVAGEGGPLPGRFERRKVERELDRALEQRMRDDGYTPPSAHPKPSGQPKPSRHPKSSGQLKPSEQPKSSGQPKPSAYDTYLRRSPHARSGGAGRESPRKSPIMDDAREVAAKRKRQLGGARPR